MEPFIIRPPTRDRQPFRTLTPSNRVPRGADSDLCVPPRRATPCTVWYRCGGNALQHWASRGREKSLSYAGLAIVHNAHKHHFLTYNEQASGSSPLFGFLFILPKPNMRLHKSAVGQPEGGGTNFFVAPVPS